MNLLCQMKKIKTSYPMTRKGQTFGKREFHYKAIYIPYKIIQNFTFVHDLNFYAG